jgi:predicted MPP superfamily phosphohydrolase
MTLLVNEAHTVSFRNVPIQFLGLCWGGPSTSVKRQWNEEYTLTQSTEHLMRMRNRNAFQIMLAHHPHAWDHARDVPLTLAGHTHGGQLMLNEKLGAGSIMFRYWTGLYERTATDEHSAGALVVSNGVGNWFPLRVSAPAEIIHITLRCPA